MQMHLTFHFLSLKHNLNSLHSVSMNSLSTQHVCALKHCTEITQHYDFSLLMSSLLTTEYLLDYCGKQ